MKSETAQATATVKDFSNGADGSLEVEVPYSYEFPVIENDTELRAEFSTSQLIDLANARKKASANSTARQQAVALYAQDPNSEAAIRERMIKDAIKARPSLTREKAEAFVDSLLNS